VRLALATLAILATVLGTAGATTLLLERRIAALAPGGVEIGALAYNPLSGRLVMDRVRARDAAGLVLFRADAVTARVSPFRLARRPLTLSQARLTAPRLTLHAASGLDVVELAAGFGTAPSGIPGLALRIEDLAVAGGSLVVEGDGAVPLRARDLDVRLSRLTTATPDPRDVAFAVEMAVYGTVVHVTGQPRAGGYAVRVRARGIDVAALARDFPLPALQGLEQGRGDVDLDLRLADSRVLASGLVRLTDVTLVLPGPERRRLRARALAVTADFVDLDAGTGRISRLEIDAPALALPVGTAAPTLAALVEALRQHPALIVRRLSVTDGTVTLDGANGVDLKRIQVWAQLSELRGDGHWTVSARAALGARGAVAIEGVLARDLRELDAATRVQGIALARWRTLLGLPAGWDARLSFEGRLHATLGRSGPPRLLVTGDVSIVDGALREAAVTYDASAERGLLLPLLDAASAAPTLATPVAATVQSTPTGVPSP
jgi:uncharacterized protein DUF748